jgi:predicted amidohydrolase
MLKQLNVALAQTSSRIGDKEHNLNMMKRNIKQAKQKDADLVIFPELALTGYICRDLMYEIAEPIPAGPSIRHLEEVTKREEIHLIFGMPERSEKAYATLYNTAVLLGPSGFIGKYRKAHLPTHSAFEEKRYFRLGYQAPVFETSIGTIGMIICYDIFFPEITRLLRLKGSKLIVCISASPAVRRKFFETLTVARAIENTVYLAYVNLVGVEDGLQFWGGSRIVAPNGKIVSQAKYEEEDLVTERIDYTDSERVETFVPTLRDLRPELFDLLKEYSENM